MQGRQTSTPDLWPPVVLWPGELFHMFGGGCYYLESGHMDDAGLGVVGGAGWIVTFGCGARGHRHADDGAGAVWMVTVQRNRLLKFGVQTGTTGDKKETEWLRFQPSFSKSGNWKAQKLNNCVTYRIMNSMSPGGFSICFSFRFIGPSQRLSPSTKRPLQGLFQVNQELL